MEELVSFETAKLAQEKGFNTPCNIVFDLQNNNEMVDFRDKAAVEFIKDCETGYRDKALNYFKEDFKRTDNNNDGDYYISRPTKFILQEWLRENHNIEVLVSILPKQMREKMNQKKYCGYIINEDWNPTVPSRGSFCDEYGEAFEAGLQEALKTIENENRN